MPTSAKRRAVDLDLNLLKIFCAVADQGSVSRAATSLRVSKASVSRKLAQLESELGHSLFFRSTTSISLTSFGRKLLGEASPALERLTHAVQSLAQSAEDLEATVRITAPEDFGAEVLVPLLARFGETRPGVRVECLFTERMTDMVRESIDLAVRMGRVTGDELVARKVADVSFDVVASKAYVDRLERPIDADTLGEHVSVAFGMNGSHAPMTFPDRERGFAFPARIWSRSFASIYNLILEGHGATFLPRFLVEEDCAAGRLVRVASERAPAPIAASLVTLERRRSSPAAMELLRFLQAQLPRVLS